MPPAKKKPDSAGSRGSSGASRNEGVLKNLTRIPLSSQGKPLFPSFVVAGHSACPCISGKCPGFFGVVMLSGCTAHTCAPTRDRQPSHAVCGLSRRPSVFRRPRSLPSPAFPLHPGIVGRPPSALTACGLPRSGCSGHGRRGGFGTRPRGALFPTGSVVREDIFYKCRLKVNNKIYRSRISARKKSRRLEHFAGEKGKRETSAKGRGRPAEGERKTALSRKTPGRMLRNAQRFTQKMLWSGKRTDEPHEPEKPARRGPESGGIGMRDTGNAGYEGYGTPGMSAVRARGNRDAGDVGSAGAESRDAGNRAADATGRGGRGKGGCQRLPVSFRQQRSAASQMRCGPRTTSASDPSRETRETIIMSTSPARRPRPR